MHLNECLNSGGTLEWPQDFFLKSSKAWAWDSYLRSQGMVFGIFCKARLLGMSHVSNLGNLQLCRLWSQQGYPMALTSKEGLMWQWLGTCQVGKCVFWDDISQHSLESKQKLLKTASWKALTQASILPACGIDEADSLALLLGRSHKGHMGL